MRLTSHNGFSLRYWHKGMLGYAHMNTLSENGRGCDGMRSSEPKEAAVRQRKPSGFFLITYFIIFTLHHLQPYSCSPEKAAVRRSRRRLFVKYLLNGLGVQPLIVELEHIGRFETSEMLARFLGSTPLLSWKICGRSNVMAPKGFLTDEVVSVTYIAFSGVQLVDGLDPSCGILVPLSAASGVSPFSGGFSSQLHMI
ncbi:hypothetical protein L2E82_40441 [Cichorium intybus]|uniref:Uncharacterized protein n=1 Tax=Cichorium intybus TaxID=13427 RepID=A0ACB9ALD4_CICIN|nr:hypothetical protein L2E82_40441 [Cichorium intybus]